MAIVLYAVSTVLLLLQPAIFYTTRVQKDVLCQLASNGFAVDHEWKNATVNNCSGQPLTFSPMMPQLATTNATELYQQCIVAEDDNFATVSSCYKNYASWRWPVYIATIYLPICCCLIEFSVNRIQIPPWIVIVQIGVGVAYLLCNFIGQMLLSQPIYPDTIDWLFEQN